MTTRVLLSLLALPFTLLLASPLGPSASEPPGDGPDGTPHPGTARATAVTEAIVWTVRDGAAVSARIVTAQDETGFRMVDVLDGVVVATETGLWASEEYRVRLREADCRCVNDALDAGSEDFVDCALWTLRTRFRMRDMLGGGLMEPGTLAGTEDADAVETFGESLRFAGSVGALVVVEHCGGVYYCGAAHPTETCVTEVWDLDSGDRRPLVDVLGTDPLTPPLAEAAAARLEAEYAAFGEGDLEVTGMRLGWLAGAPGYRLRVTVPECYACSDGEWTAYTVSTWVDAPFPPSLAAAAAPPAFVRAYLDQLEGEIDAWGWSTPLHR